MTTSSTNRPSDLVAHLNQKALLDLAVDSHSSAPPRSYRLPTIDELGKLFPDLEIIELLGTGGMGCVFKARQKKLDRMVAVKILPRELASDDLFAERFAREARAMARLNHPHIVAIHDFGDVDDMYFLTMEYMDGMNLRELIDAKALDPHEALGVFQQVCNALAFAHSEGVVHRDIKPENILFDRQGHVALADFGLARLAMDSNCEISITQTRQAMGTLNYMAPEQYENPKGVDHRADIYAMGVLLYELMTGKVPRGSFPPASSICPTGPKVDHVINKCLQVSPDDRYADLPTLMAELTGDETVLQGHAGANGTFTNFMNIGAAPFRLVGKLASGASAPPPPVVEGTHTWVPLQWVTYATIVSSFLLMLFPWSREDSHIALVAGDDRYPPPVLILPILAILSQLAKYRHRLHPIRWFLMCFFCFIGVFGIGISFTYRETFAVNIFLGIMVYLAFEFSFYVIGAVGKKLLGGAKPRSVLPPSLPDFDGRGNR